MRRGIAIDRRTNEWVETQGLTDSDLEAVTEPRIGESDATAAIIFWTCCAALGLAIALSLPFPDPHHHTPLPPSSALQVNVKDSPADGATAKAEPK